MSDTTLEGAIRSILLADAGVAALTTTVHSATDPQKSSRPKLTYQRVTTRRDICNDGPLSLAVAVVQLDCWADTDIAAKGLAEATRKALAGYVGVNGEIDIKCCRITAEGDETSAPLPGAQSPVQRVRLEVTVNFIDP